MESPAAGGDPRPSPSGGASPPPPPPPPPPSGWLAGLVSGAGRLLASVLGPDSSPTCSGSTASGRSASSSPTSARHTPARGGGSGLDDSMRFASKNNQLNQSEGYAGASLALISEIEPKDVIMQLLMQETFSRSECAMLIKIIQERVVDPDSPGVIDGYIPLPISWKAEKQPNLGYSSFSPNVSSPSPSTFPIHRHGFDSNAAADAVPTRTPASRGLFNHYDDNIESTKKRSYSVVRDTPEDLRRVRTKIDGNPINITKFKQVDVVRHRPGGDHKNNEPTFFKSGPIEDPKHGFPLKVKHLNDLIPFERKMMDLSHENHKDAACDDSGSVSKLMFKEDIEATPSLQMGLQLQNGSKNRRRKQSNSPRTTTKISEPPAMGTRNQANSPRTTPKLSEPPAMGTRNQANSPRTIPKLSEPPAMGTRSKISDSTVKVEIDLLEQIMPLSSDKQDPDYLPEKKPVGRTKKGK
ncbi:uncharacterized protein [Lolium perenne]|uniref:uncharacterized protein isoform X2 n=1 Tax=Lolium perenne TaxID=4522 RepID=UPI0021F5F224|nr:uncharacterized protein LOC127311763 isoform X2 [Lolium perenne]